MRTEIYPFPAETEQEEGPKVSFKEFLATSEAESGSVIEGVKPSELFTTQDWLDDAKVANVLGYIEDRDPRLTEITGYLHYHTKFDRNVIVIGNGNHRALYALISGKRIDVAIEDPRILLKENPFRLKNLLKKYGNVFSSF